MALPRPYPFAHLLGLARMAKPATTTSTPLRPKLKAARVTADFSHLRTAAPPPPSPTERSVERGAAARALAAYNHANGTTARTAARTQPAINGPRPDSPAARAIASYEKALGR